MSTTLKRRTPRTSAAAAIAGRHVGERRRLSFTVGAVCDGTEATCTIGGETGGKTSTATAESIAAPTPGADDMGGNACVLTGGTTSDTGVRGFNGGYSAATDRPTATIIPGDGGMS